MGWQTTVAVVFQAGNRIIINPKGLFVYNGKPSGGNLIFSIAPVAGTDAFFNSYPSGATVIGPSGSPLGNVNMSPNGGFGGFPAILFNIFNALTAVLPQLVAAARNLHLSTEQVGITISSGKENSAPVGDDAAIQLISESLDQTLGAAIIFEFGGTIINQLSKAVYSIGTKINATAGTATNPTVITTDTWHTAILGNGWVGAGGTNGIRYMLSPDNRILIEGDISNPAAVGNSVCAILTSAPYNAGLTRNIAAGWNNVGGTSPAWLNYNGGTLTIAGYNVANIEMFFDGWIPLN